MCVCHLRSCHSDIYSTTSSFITKAIFHSPTLFPSYCTVECQVTAYHIASSNAIVRQDSYHTRKLAKMMRHRRRDPQACYGECPRLLGRVWYAHLRTRRHWYTLRQRPNRLSQLCYEGFISFPAERTDVTMTKSLLAVLTMVLAMRKAIVAKPGQVLNWTALSLGGTASEDTDNGNWVAAAPTSPPYIFASQPAIPIEDIPALVLETTTNSHSMCKGMVT